MALPFSVEQFVGVFRDYNLAIWPGQVIMYILAMGSVGLAFTRLEYRSRIISAVLAFFWVWNGVAYHIKYFVQINPVAKVFGLVFVLQGILLFWQGTVKNRIDFTVRTDQPQGAIGCLFMVYAAVIYPVLGVVFGHGFPYSPLLGVAPCPTTIFTFGLFLLAQDRMPLKLIWIPLLWSMLGFKAATALGIKEDVGLLIAGLVTSTIICYGKLKYRRLKPVFVEK